jgi:hypothetical protein
MLLIIYILYGLSKINYKWLIDLGNIGSKLRHPVVDAV